MQMKKIIINADDFGYSKDVNEAVKAGAESGIITSASLMANGKEFNHAINEILPQVPDLDLGFHFNIIEGKSLSDSKYLCNTKGVFNNSFSDILIKSKNKKFLYDVENEFRMQIEKVLECTAISHIDSHVHTHAIPPLFNLITRLAKEYNVKFIRTQKEIPYIVPKKVLNTKFPINIIKNILLNTFSVINNYEYTNNYFIGVLYTGYMDEDAITYGLKRIKKDNTITEIIFHPNINALNQNNYNEFLITQNPHLKQEILNAGFELTNYSKLY